MYLYIFIHPIIYIYVYIYIYTYRRANGHVYPKKWHFAAYGQYIYIPCVQEVVTPFYIVTYYIKWGNYFLDTQ